MKIEENIMVSIVCNTYNQEDYIADALESFVMQKQASNLNFLYTTTLQPMVLPIL